MIHSVAVISISWGRHQLRLRDRPVKICTSSHSITSSAKLYNFCQFLLLIYCIILKQ